MAKEARQDSHSAQEDNGSRSFQQGEGSVARLPRGDQCHGEPEAGSQHKGHHGHRGQDEGAQADQRRNEKAHCRGRGEGQASGPSQGRFDQKGGQGEHFQVLTVLNALPEERRRDGHGERNEKRSQSQWGSLLPTQHEERQKSQAQGKPQAALAVEEIRCPRRHKLLAVCFR